MLVLRWAKAGASYALAVVAGLAFAGAVLLLLTMVGVPVPWPDELPNLLAPFMGQDGDDCLWVLSQGGCW